MKFARTASLTVVLLALIAMPACGGGAGGPDLGDDAGGACENDVDCSDDVFCNGVELCDPEAEGADERGCAPPASTACEGACDEASNQCVDPGCPDADGDGFYVIACGGSDCDDDDADRFPGNLEVCDATHDEDCNPATVGARDADEDGQTDDACCNAGQGTPVCGTDCDDSRNVVYRGNSEVCDGFDNDCDTMTDEAVGVRYYDDCDGDGVGGGTGAVLCAPSMCMGHPAVTSSSDCDDANASFRPGASGTCGVCPNPSNTTETCNDVDDDCSGTKDDNGASASCPATPNGTSGCLSGTCGIASCDTNYHVCGTACVFNGAIATCGASCTPCATPSDPNAHATCNGTACSFACDDPYTRVGDGCALLGASHVDDVTLLPSGETALHVTSGQVVVVDTDTGGIATTTGTVIRAVSGDTSGIGYTTQSQGNGVPQLAIFTFSTITVDAGGTLQATGARAVVLLASGNVSIAGLLDVSASPAAGGRGPGGFAGGATPGPSGGASGIAPGGGGHGGTGGSGANVDNCAGGSGGSPTTADASGAVLMGGSAGGGTETDATVGGGGGGAVQVTSMTSIVVGGTVRAVGAGGRFRNGGAGAGGTIFLEAPTVQINGVVTVNGGGGASYFFAGQLGTDSTTRALGGNSQVESGGGGAGAAGSHLGGEEGTCGSGPGGGGGGGGGRIWFITESGARTGAGLATPSGSVQQRSESIVD